MCGGGLVLMNSLAIVLLLFSGGEKVKVALSTVSMLLSVDAVVLCCLE